MRSLEIASFHQLRPVNSPLASTVQVSLEMIGITIKEVFTSSDGQIAVPIEASVLSSWRGRQIETELSQLGFTFCFKKRGAAIDLILYFDEFTTPCFVAESTILAYA